MDKVSEITKNKKEMKKNRKEKEITEVKMEKKAININVGEIVETVETDIEENLNLPISNPEDIKEIDLMQEGQIIVDRDEEDSDVVEFQKTNDLRLLEKVYKNRIPTIKNWANKHYYPGLTHSVEDLFEELSFVFVKAAQNYNKSRGTFNTCLFTFFLNRIKNLKSSKHAKKRMSEYYTGPISGMILSLDYVYNDKDGSQITLKDIIKNPETVDKAYVHRTASFDETVKTLSFNNPIFKNFLLKISEGGSLNSLLKEYKTKTGRIKINEVQAKKLNHRKSKKFVSELIKNEKDIASAFKVINYSLDDSSNLTYEIEMKKTTETDSILKIIRDLRKNKQFYMEKIRGLV